MTSAFLALQLWLQLPADKINFVVVPFDRIFQAVHSGEAEAGLIIHEGQLTWQKEGLNVCQDLGAWWKSENDGLPLPPGRECHSQAVSAGDAVSHFPDFDQQHPIQSRPPGGRRGPRLAVRPGHGTGTGGSIRRHVCQSLDAGLWRERPGRH